MRCLSTICQPTLTIPSPSLSSARRQTKFAHSDFCTASGLRAERNERRSGAAPRAPSGPLGPPSAPAGATQAPYVVSMIHRVCGLQNDGWTNPPSREPLQPRDQGGRILRPLPPFLHTQLPNFHSLICIISSHLIAPLSAIPNSRFN